MSSGSFLLIFRLNCYDFNSTLAVVSKKIMDLNPEELSVYALNNLISHINSEIRLDYHISWKCLQLNFVYC